ncbi:MAG: STAS domain-containing protein [Alphaproteobacteria bacterium]|nr:STAS domain-containing protein [Alphaproteobacteria bacterium]
MTESARTISLHPFRPRLIEAFRNYKTADFLSDLLAGITVGIVALPLAMAFAIASGLKPENGIFTAIVAGFIISAFGGTRVQIGGPAGAFIVVVYSIIAQYGVDGLLVATIMAGFMLFCLGLFRLGTLVRFVPVSIVIGFTNGIAVLIALSQVKDFLGLKIENLPSEFFSRMLSLATHLPTADFITMALGAGCLALVFGWPWLTEKMPAPARKIAGMLPGSILALAAGTAATYYLHLDVDTIGTRFGGLPRSLPALSLPRIDFAMLQHLLPPALTIALLGAIESLLCARVADSITEDRHDPNQELMAQGLANIASPLLGGYSATGTIARTMTNIRFGARSPLSGIVHSITLLAIIMLAAPLAQNVPLAALAAILLYVAYNMGEWHEFARLKHFAPSYRAVLLTTFFLTIVIDLSVAVEAGLVLACLFFIMRVSNLTRIEPVAELEGFPAAHFGDRVEAYRIYGSLFFGAAAKIEGLMNLHRPIPKIIILDLGTTMTIDATGVEALESLKVFLEKRGSRLILCNFPAEGKSFVKTSALAHKFGEGMICATFREALEKADLYLKT